VLITGASRGLGAALAQSFASAGWKVAAGARQPGVLISSAALTLRFDVTEAGGIETAVQKCVEELGALDVLVNNAGVIADGLSWQLDDESWQRALDVNLRGAFLCSKAVARQMIRQRDGHIINIASFGARSGPAGQSNYAAAKAGLIGLTQSLAKEFGSRNVRVNAILPGVLPTNMTAKLTTEQLEGFAKANALGRINSLAEVARFIVFLARMENISGQIFQLDSRIAPWT
jgi:3-oxoacyl-[acyl-carrier protein] reductase